MTNYRAYLCGAPSGKSLSKHELKLKRALAFGDKKKIAEALWEMHGAKDICIQIPHFKGEEVMTHIQTVMETICDTSEWHIPRIPYRSKKRCHAI